MQKKSKKIKKILALYKGVVYNTSCRHDIGLSPSGKAPDSDSGIPGVRIPQAQLVPRNFAGDFFLYTKLHFLYSCAAAEYGYYQTKVSGKAAAVERVLKTLCS